MALNLFDNIFDQFKGQAQPQVPSFGTPTAPRTNSYVAPNVAFGQTQQQTQQATQPIEQPRKMSLFSDEQQMFQSMKADNLPDDTAYSMLKKRRMDLLGGNDLANDEKEILLKMQADNVPVKEAVSMIQNRRKDQFNKMYNEGNLLQKGAYNTLAFAAGNLETLAKYSGNTLDFITGGAMWFGDEVKKMEQVTSSPEFSESSAFTAGTYAPDVALAVSPLGGGYIAGSKGMGQLALRSGIVGAGFGASTPIMNEGSDATMEDIATSAAVGGTIGAVSTPVLSKVFKYGKAGYYGGKEGVGKSISRDVNGVVDSVTAIPSQIASIPSKIKSTIIKSPEDRLVSKLGQENTQGVVQGKTVNIPVPKKGIVETVTMGLGREKDTKVLAGRALTPSYAGKTPKQIVNTTADVEKNTKKLYEGVRTGEYQGDISTLDEAANTVVTNLERIGAQIGDDVKGAVGKVKPSNETKSTILSTLKNKIEQRSGAYSILKNFLTDTGKGLSVQDAMKAKRVYQTEIGKLIRSGDAGTDSYSALVKGVQELSDNIDGVVEKSIGSKEFLKRKAQYSHLKKLVTDIAKSAAVEGRRSPQTFVEQLGMVESMLDAVRNPLSTAGRIFAKEIGELNTRGGAWKELIKIYDTEAIKAVKKPIITPKKKVITPDKPIVKPNTIKNESKVVVTEKYTSGEKPMVDKLVKQANSLKPKSDEVIVYQSGKSEWVDTDINKQINRGIGGDAKAFIVKKSDLQKVTGEHSGEGIYKVTNQNDKQSLIKIKK